MTQKQNIKFDVIIIGSGLGGMLSALILSNLNYKVLVLEKHKVLGGNLQSFKRNDIIFDTGMHYFGAFEIGGFLNGFFNYNNILHKLNICEFYSGNFDSFVYKGKFYSFPTGFQNFTNFLKTNFPDNSKNIDEYISILQKTYKNLNAENIHNNFFDNELLHISVNDFFDKLNFSFDLKQILTSNSFLYDTSGGNAPFYIHAVIISSLVSGARKFCSPSADFVKILTEKIIKNGGKFISGKNVNSFVTDENRIVSCKTDDGDEFFADKFISAIHPANVIKFSGARKLLGKAYVKRVLSLKQTKSVFAVYIIFSENTFKYSDTNFYFSTSFRNSALCMFTTPVSGKKGEFATNAKILALADFNDFVFDKNTENTVSCQKYYDFKQKFAEKLIDATAEHFPDLKKSIFKYYTSSPLTLENFTSTPQGGIYGVERTVDKITESYIPVRTKIQNLFLTGQNINFHGFLGVSVAALLTCSAVTGEKIVF